LGRFWVLFGEVPELTGNFFPRGFFSVFKEKIARREKIENRFWGSRE
jgi:hypothetical protein